MKTLRIITICLTFLFLTILFVFQRVLPPQIAEICFFYKADNKTIKLKTWYEENSRTFYLFIPSFIEPSNLQDELGRGIFLRNPHNGNVISIVDCKVGEQYEIISDNNRDILRYLCIKRLSNIPTLIVNTKSGTTKKIDFDKNYKEEITINGYTADGFQFLENVRGKIKGRGASSWEQPKKSYVLSANDSLNLFGMGNGIKWNLLSNSFDESNLRNKIVYDFAKQIGLETSPDCEFVDLFLNGGYAGLYLLSEKVEFGRGRVDVAGNPRYLFTLTSERQSKNKNIIFNEESGVRVALYEPKLLSDDEYVFLSNLLYDFDNSIINKCQRTISIDTTTWALTYLVDEIFANSDANYLSSYLYTYGDCSTFYRGPVWDYDQSIGNNIFNEDPNSFLAIKWRISRSIETPYYWKLMRDSSFRNDVSSMYKNRALPLIETLCNQSIDCYYDYIRYSSESNSLRWNDMYQSIESLPWRKESSSIDSLKNYLCQRKCFLYSTWVDSINYHVVLLEKTRDYDYKVLTLKDGDYINSHLIENREYLIRETGEVFNPDSPITRDLELNLKPEKGEDSIISNLQFNKVILIRYLLILVFGCLFIILLVRNCSDVDKN